MTSSSSTDRKLRLITWGIWILTFAVILGDVARRPFSHTTMKTYRFASTQWWAGQDPYTYDNHSGFLYFPQAAFLFTPFNLLPFALGELFWRVFAFGLFFYALMRLNQFFLSQKNVSSAKSFLILSLLAVPSSLASLRNAQFDLPLAALIVLTAAEVAAARWNAATAWLCLAVALKPLAVVPLLLFGALYWKLIPRFCIGILIVLALPFIHWSPVYVAHEYGRCLETLAWASKGNEPRYSDLAALISHLSLYPPDWIKTLARVFFALLYLGLGFFAVKRLTRNESAWTIGALSADYLMLFNPRTETCSYVFLGPFVASLAIVFLNSPRCKWLGYVLGFAALGLACDAVPKIEGLISIHDLTDRWFKPLIALLFFPVLVRFIFGRREERDDGKPGF